MKSTATRLLTNPTYAANVASDLIVDLIRWPRVRATRSNTYLAARYLHALTSGRSSALALTVARSAPFSQHRLQRSVPVLEPKYRVACAALHRDGITPLPDLLDQAAVQRLVDFGRTAPAKFGGPSHTRSRGTYVDRPIDTRSVRIVEHFVINNADVQRIIANRDLVDLAEHYFGTQVLVHPPQLYWTCAPASQNDAGPSMHERPNLQISEEFHWDFDGLGGLRLHIYLTDVDEGSAPMMYFPGSHRPGSLKSWRLRNADRGVGEEDVARSFRDTDSLTITGPAGTTFMTNSNGLHRGTPAVSSDRLFLVMPIQATSFAGYQLKPRHVVPKDPDFAALLAAHSPALRWFGSDVAG